MLFHVQIPACTANADCQDATSNAGTCSYCDIATKTCATRTGGEACNLGTSVGTCNQAGVCQVRV